MVNRTAYPGTAVTNDVLTAANVNNLPGGWIGYVEATSSQTGISSETDLTSLSVTVTVNTTRRILIQGYVPCSGTAVDDRALVRIKESSTVLQLAAVPIQNAASVNAGSGSPAVVITPSSGSHTYKLSLERATGGSGSVGTNVSSTQPAWLGVIDIGPST